MPSYFLLSINHINYGSLHLRLFLPNGHSWYVTKWRLCCNVVNEQRIIAALMEKALSWTAVKSEDVKALHKYISFLRGCCNVMNDTHYMYELNMYANLLTIVKILYTKRQMKNTPREMLPKGYNLRHC